MAGAIAPAIFLRGCRSRLQQFGDFLVAIGKCIRVRNAESGHEVIFSGAMGDQELDHVGVTTSGGVEQRGTPIGTLLGSAPLSKRSLAASNDPAPTATCNAVISAGPCPTSVRGSAAMNSFTLSVRPSAAAA